MANENEPVSVPTDQQYKVIKILFSRYEAAGHPDEQRQWQDHFITHIMNYVNFKDDFEFHLLSYKVHVIIKKTDVDKPLRDRVVDSGWIRDEHNGDTYYPDTAKGRQDPEDESVTSQRATLVVLSPGPWDKITAEDSPYLGQYAGAEAARQDSE